MEVKNKKQILSVVNEGVVPVIEGKGYEVVETSYVFEDGENHLYIYIYKKGGVSLDDCVFVNNLVDPVLDQLDPTKGEPYVLDISSPGLDRPIKTDKDFLRNMGEEVDVKLYASINKRKVFTGRLKEKTDTEIVIESNLGEQRFPLSAVCLVTPHINFNVIEGAKNEQ